MPKDYVATVRIRRPRKVTTDDRGRTVWNEPVESVELELVSTTALEKILGSDDGKTRGEIRRLIKGRKDGVLAKDTATGRQFPIDPRITRWNPSPRRHNRLPANYHW